MSCGSTIISHKKVTEHTRCVSSTNPMSVTCFVKNFPRIRSFPILAILSCLFYYRPHDTSATLSHCTFSYRSLFSNENDCTFRTVSHWEVNPKLTALLPLLDSTVVRLFISGILPLIGHCHLAIHGHNDLVSLTSLLISSTFNL